METTGGRGKEGQATLEARLEGLQRELQEVKVMLARIVGEP